MKHEPYEGEARATLEAQRPMPAIPDVREWAEQLPAAIVTVLLGARPTTDGFTLPPDTIDRLNLRAMGLVEARTDGNRLTGWAENVRLALQEMGA